ncbi:MAG: 3-phosphoshikimate 1-carboxyvinyltransferase [Mediterranea sp.]|jgi:3-phosphoshikimate 1-carboxyvinyltransferase|nr:3-phosphoshikimate 1-carboxyvinyltransferase [Mediterranea sp.]
MHYQLTFPSRRIHAAVALPPSKSISNRVLIIHALAGGNCLPANLSDCDDTRVMVEALSRRRGEGEGVIDIMAAGTAMRFLTAYLSVTPGVHVITGTERMRQRPIRILVDALRELGAAIEYMENDGYPPLRITGKALAGQAISLKGDVSSQYISALLMIAPTLQEGLRLSLAGEIISRPYIDLTLQLMETFGVQAGWDSESSLSIRHQPYRSTPFTVESDWSAASYWYQLLALAQSGEVELRGLLPDSHQGDSRGAEIFSRLGVSTTFTDRGALLKKTGCCTARLDEDMTGVPDLAQTIAVTCALLNIPFSLRGLQTLKIKETDRMAALIAETAKLGYAIGERNNAELFWNGERIPPQEQPLIQTYEDHRMAMAFAPAAIRLPQLAIAEPQVVTKSYPAYWEDLKKAGAHIQTVH